MRKNEIIKEVENCRLPKGKKSRSFRKYLLYIKGINEKIFGYKIRKFIHPILLKVVKKMRDYELVPIGNTDDNISKIDEILKTGPVIYAINHSNVHDVPTANEIIKKHSYLLASDEVRGTFNGFLFELMGVVWVQREKKKDSRIELPPKEHMLKLLEENQSIKIFPERTWNVTDNEIILPFKWGTVLIAQKSQRPIIPIIMEYDYIKKVCYYNIGQSILISKDDDLVNANNHLRDKMASLRYEIWESTNDQNDIRLDGKAYTDYSRKRFYNGYKQKIKEEYSMFEEKEEAEFIYRPYVTAKDAFKHLDNIIPNHNNAFLFAKTIKQ